MAHMLEGELLKAMSKALEPEGGWAALPLSVQACHGDLIDIPMLGHEPASDVLAGWLRKQIDVVGTQSLSDETYAMLQRGAS